MRKLLTYLHVLIGVAALAGGVALVAEPSGALIGLSPSALLGFTSFLLPGIGLLVLGLVQLGAALWNARPGPAGLVASQVGGGALVLWIAFESVLVAPIHPLQIVGALLGAAIFMIAHELHVTATHAPAA